MPIDLQCSYRVNMFQLECQVETHAMCPVGLLYSCSLPYTNEGHFGPCRPPRICIIQGTVPHNKATASSRRTAERRIILRQNTMPAQVQGEGNPASIMHFQA